MRNEAGVCHLVQRTRDSKEQVGYSVAGRSRGRVMLCAVCTVYKETRSTGFLVQP
jgi:alpha-D-ribose 1-methylphosphonate 5-triphosphate synthase subunit PhnG